MTRETPRRRVRRTATIAFVALVALAARARAEDAPDEEPPRPRVTATATVDDALYATTGRLLIDLEFETDGPIARRLRVLMHVVRKDGDAAFVEADHVPPVATTEWKPKRAVTWRQVIVVPPELDGTRAAVEIRVGLVDPSIEKEDLDRGRWELTGTDPASDRRYVVATVAKPEADGPPTTAELVAAASKLLGEGRARDAFHVLETAYERADDLSTQLRITDALLRVPPFDPDSISGPEQVRINRLIAAEKLRYLRDRASSLLRRNELKLALRVMERIGGVAEEERNTRVAGEVSEAERATKDLVDVKSRILRTPDEDRAEFGRLIEATEGAPKKLLAEGKKARAKKRLHLARTLYREVQINLKHDDDLRDEARSAVEEIEKEILYSLTPEEEKRLEQESDHPSFHRLEAVPSGRFIWLGPKTLVTTIPRDSAHRFDVASLLLTDLHGRRAVPEGERVIVFWKETWDFGGATAGGSVVNVGRAQPDARGTRVDTGLFYHEFTHCVDDARPVHNHKGGLTEGIANVGRLFVFDMFAGVRGKFDSLAKPAREQFGRFHVRRESAYWRIAGYAPSEGFLLEILARHARAPDGHVDWPKLAKTYRLFRDRKVKVPHTHRIMAHFGHCLAEAMGPDVWKTLEEFRFPVGPDSQAELDAQVGTWEDELTNRARFGRIDAVLRLANDAEAMGGLAFAARARFLALWVLGRMGKPDGTEAQAIRKTLGLIETMRVAGPFFPKGTRGLASVFPPDFEFAFDKEYPSGGEVARWKIPERGATHFAKLEPNGGVKLDYGYPDHAVTYVLAHATVRAATDAIAWIGADDEAALWVNGVEIERNDDLGGRGALPDHERWPIHLRAGRNRLLLKIANNRGPTGFIWRLSRADGKPVDGLAWDNDPPREADVGEPIAQPKWRAIFEDVYRRKSLGSKYEVVAGSFKIRNKELSGEGGRGTVGWRPFAVRPGFPQDRPAALAWIDGAKKKLTEDFEWRIRAADRSVPKLVLTWDGEEDTQALSGWSLILLPNGGGKTFGARLERYDVLRWQVAGLEAPPADGKHPIEIVVRRVGGRVTVLVDEVEVFKNVSAPALKPRALGFGVWGPGAKLSGMAVAIPR